MSGKPATGTVTVLCITGWCRSGSTIIGNILNESPGVFHVGELHFLWKNAANMGANNLCGCGRMLTDCPFWSSILPLGRPAGMPAGDFAAEVLRRQRSSVRTRHTWRVLRNGLDGPDICGHADLMTRTYHAIAARTGAGVIVDTSKIPGEAALLARLDGVTPYFVHLVRDPRAVAESWRHPKQYVYTMSASVSTAYWHGFNLAVQAITRRYPARSMFLRFEDFIANPTGTIDQLLRFCGADPGANPIRGRQAELGENHTVTGNPDRFRRGTAIVRDTDDAWRASLQRRAKLAAMALSWPLLRRYGYRLGSARGTAAGDPPATEPSGHTRTEGADRWI